MVDTDEQVPLKDERSVIDAAADLLQLIVDWLRQEAEGIMHDKVVIPLQRLGFTLFAASAAATLMVLGMGFISVGSLILLAEWLGWWGALYAVGGTLLIGSAGFLWFKMRLVQK